MDTLITPSQKKVVIAVAVICYAVMWLVGLRLHYVIAH
jgi:hypothetical protein